MAHSKTRLANVFHCIITDGITLWAPSKKRNTAFFIAGIQPSTLDTTYHRNNNTMERYSSYNNHIVRHSIFFQCLLFVKNWHARNGYILIFIYSVCWALLFFWHAFDFTNRVFRVPLLLLSAPVLLGLSCSALGPYLRRSALLWCVAAIALAACIAGYLSPIPSSRSYSHIIFGWLVLTLAGLTMKLAAPDKALRFMLLGLIAGLASSSLWAALCAVFGLADTNQILLGGTRLQLFTGYAATLGLMSGFAATGLFVFWKHKRRLISARIDPALMAGAMLLLVLAQARAALFSFILCVGAAVILAAKRPLRMFACVVLCGVLSIGAALALGQFSPFKESASFQRMLTFISQPTKDLAVTGRLVIWEVAAESFMDRPATGYGMRMFPQVYAGYMEKHGDAMHAKYGFREQSGTHAHNLILGILTELGILGFLPLICIYITAFRIKSPSPGSDIHCLHVLFLYFFLHGLTEYMLSRIIYSDLFFASLGILIGSGYYEWRKKQGAALIRAD